MRKFAQIVGGKVLAVFTTANEPNWDASIMMADVTDLDCTVGQTAEIVDGQWVFGPIAEVIPIPATPMKTHYTHREFILRIGEHYASIERLKDSNAALSPDQKNYELSRLFTLWDKSKDIDLNDNDLHAAFDAFVGLGLMTSADALAVLTPNEVA